ncbi:MAG TPA: DciA family protein [Steroidobacteraceae bacterium]|jgi:hypothetical protein|nr:DciA family protein [Steroidobacteraceae bacterium]
MRSGARREAPATHSVKELLARVVPGLTRVTEAVSRENYWSSWLSQQLPAEIHARISGLSEQRGTLVVFAESSAWCARLRYALLELEPDIRAAAPAVKNIQVRVLPRG